MGHLQLIAAGIKRAFADAIFRRELRTMRALIREVSGICSYLPYSMRAYAVRVRRPPKRVIRYGARRVSKPGAACPSEMRKCIDVYGSGDHDDDDGGGEEDDPKPLLLFVHGGAWGSGERWHYAPLANALADQNVIVGVCSYPMFPDVLVPEMVEDVRDAVVHFRECFSTKSARKRRRFTVLGHSSGAHLLAMAMLTNGQEGCISGLGQHPPDCFIGISGPYDITAHYAYENVRGVAELSPMRDAMGGPENFVSNSPMMRIPDRNDTTLTSPSGVPTAPPPRTYLFDSADDNVVKAEQSRRFGELLRSAKWPAMNMSYRDVAHAGFVIQTRRRGAPSRKHDQILPNNRHQRRTQQWKVTDEHTELRGRDTDSDSMCMYQESTEEPIIASVSTAPHLTPALRDVLHIVTL